MLAYLTEYRSVTRALGGWYGSGDSSPVLPARLPTFS